MTACQRVFIVLSISAAVLGAPTAARAIEPPALTLKGGLSSSNVDGLDNSFFESKRKMGFSGGLSASIPLATRWSLQPEILYVMKGFSFGESEATDPGGNTIGTIETLRAVDYLEIPLLLRLSLPTAGSTVLFAVLGPTFAFETGERFVVTGATEASTGTDDFSDFDAGAAFGAGLELGRGRHRWMIEGRYTHGVTNVDFGPSEIKNRTIQVMTGYVFQP